jgi:hypothetical protein
VAGRALYEPAKMGPALKTGYDRMDWVRKSYGKMVRSYTGRHYGDAGGGKSPVNLLAQYIHTVIPNLLNQRPRNIGRSRIAQLQGEATLVAIALDLLWEDLRLVDRTQALILDGLLAPWGVAKIGLRATEDIVKIGERGIMLGQPYVARVSPDDFAVDPAARAIEEFCWQAHRYRVPKEYALESGIYDADAIQRLEPMGKGEHGKPKSGVEEISGKSDKDRYAAQEYIELWDVAVREEDKWLIGTMTMSGGQVEPAWVNAGGEPIEYDGAAEGPYELLTFSRVPDNAPGLSPGATWLDLHEATDKLYNKMINQALRSKQNFAYNRAASDDAMTLAKAPDGEGIAVDNVDTLMPITTGGVAKESYEFLSSMMGMWNNSAGNMQLLAGNDIQSDKATGQQILQANANTRLSYMKDRVWRFLNAINTRLATYIVTDPLIQAPLPYRLPGGEMVDVVYDAATRKGDMVQMTFEVELASMTGRDPDIALKRKMEALDKLATYVPLAGAINLQKLARQLGREIGWLDMDEIVNDLEQQALYMQAGIGQVPRAGMPGAGGQMGDPGAAPGASPTAGVGGINERAGMVRGAMGVGAEMQGAM